MQWLRARPSGYPEAQCIREGAGETQRVCISQPARRTAADPAQVSAIIHLISSSVPDLSAKNVTVVDQNGTLLSASHDGSNAEGLDPSQLKYVRQVEQSYIDRINALLIPMFGINNVRAQVSADIDFSRTEQTSEVFTPNPSPASQAIRSEQSSLSSSTSPSNGGIPGALTNQPPVPATAPIVAAKGAAAAGAGTAGPSSRQKESTVNYEVDRTISHTVQPVGSIKRLSVAVVVNGNRTVIDAKGKSIEKPLTDAEKQQIGDLVKDAVGYDQKRGDSLNVQVAPFTEVKEVVADIPVWKQPFVIELAKDGIKYTLIAAAMLFVIFGILRPALRTLLTPQSKTGGFKATEDSGADTGAQHNSTIAPYEQSLQVARQIAQQEPKIVASVIKEWVKE